MIDLGSRKIDRDELPNYTDAADAVKHINNWIEANLGGSSFVDVGGVGLNCQNERITHASHVGASRLTMVDIRPNDFKTWKVFQEILDAENITNCRSIANADIHDDDSLIRVGGHHMVHCTGILYHVASPAMTIEKLCSISEEYLILNTVTLPYNVMNEHGALLLPDPYAILLPMLSEQQRDVLKTYYSNNNFRFNFDIVVPNLDDRETEMRYSRSGKFSCWPYWWLLSPGALCGLVRALDFEILDVFFWRNHTVNLIAKRCGGRAVPPSNSRW